MRIKRIVKAAWLPLLCGLLVFLLFHFVFLLGYVPTESMEPTMKKNSYFLGLRIFQDVEVGDIVVFEHADRLLVKRVAAGYGDTVIRGETCLLVPEGSFYMLGDNPENSYDSRYWEDPFISREQIKAVVFTGAFRHGFL